jgi:hypothetical protein
MTLKELLDKANEGYPDGAMAEYYDENGQPKAGSGDMLAEFVVEEIAETFNESKDDKAQVSEAIRVVSQAIDDLTAVEQALHKHWLTL